MKLSRLLQSGTVFLLLAVTALAQGKPAGTRRLTIEDTLEWRMASRPALSPDGKFVAYIVSENDLERSRVTSQLWRVNTETRETRRLTQADDGALDPRWSPDGRWLAFLATRGGAGETAGAQPRAQVWLLPTDGGEAAALTHAAEGIVSYRWAPDAKSVYYVTREPLPEPAAVLRERQRAKKLDAVIVNEEKYRKEIWRVTPGTHKAERVFAGNLGLDGIEPSPDGRWIVYRTNYTGDPDDDRKFDLWLLDLSAGGARQLTSRDGEESEPVWSPDSTRVAFLAPHVPDISYSQPEVFVVPIAAAGEKPAAPQQLTRDFSGNIERFAWPAKGDGIYFAAAVRTENHLYRLNPADGAVRPAGPEAIFLSAPDWSADAAECAVLVEGSGALPEVTLLKRGAGLQKLTDLNAQLKDFALGAQEIVRWKSKDGREIEGIVVKPLGWQAGKKYPLIVDIHGGPYGRRANTITAGTFTQVWAARGWMVFLPNFRGSSAYGNDFGIANRGDIGGKDYQDIMSGVDYLIAQGGADPNRMAVMGGSYGGYMTDWIISQTKRFQAAVSMFGIFNLITDFSNSDFPSWEPDYLKQYYWENLQAYLEHSAFRYVTQISTPVLILHGDEDPNTFISNSKEMYQALKALGRTVKFVRFPREGHGFREPNHRLEQFREIAAWLDEHVLSGAEPRAVGQRVRKDSWELEVAAVRTPESYAGVKPRERFVEVELLIRAAAPTEERFGLTLLDSPGSDVWLEAPDQSFYPVGIAAESLGQRVLAKSSGQVVAFVPDRDGGSAALAVTLVFDVALETRELLIHVKSFPPVRIELPVLADGPK
jgi:dipeptidyl aminopeptidase/acylaminoacyl peptidase